MVFQYLNSGPGGIGGAFVHRAHHGRPKLAGWWGNRPETRFQMRHEIDYAVGADSYRLSTPPAFMFALNKAGLEVHHYLLH